MSSWARLRVPPLALLRADSSLDLFLSNQSRIEAEIFVPAEGLQLPMPTHGAWLLGGPLVARV